MYFNYPFIASTGGYLFGDNGTNPDDIGLANDGAVESLKVFQSLKEALPINSGDINPDIKRSLFNEGDVAMDINGPWELAGYKAALGDNLGLALYPSINGKRRSPSPALKFGSSTPLRNTRTQQNCSHTSLPRKMPSCC
ncbi:hypothetical protein HMSSN139_64180 [Paenibacillus sp. HMSSN-139]|nr:hypothetical protein HMSSN139_64180 [Paenibacillus sp. HMSSN-139]